MANAKTAKKRNKTKLMLQLCEGCVRCPKNGTCKYLQYRASPTICFWRKEDVADS